MIIALLLAMTAQPAPLMPRLGTPQRAETATISIERLDSMRADIVALAGKTSSLSTSLDECRAQNIAGSAELRDVKLSLTASHILLQSYDRALHHAAEQLDTLATVSPEPGVEDYVLYGLGIVGAAALGIGVGVDLSGGDQLPDAVPIVLDVAGGIGIAIGIAHGLRWLE